MGESRAYDAVSVAEYDYATRSRQVECQADEEIRRKPEVEDGAVNFIERHILRIRVPLTMIDEEPWRVTTLLKDCLVLRAEARYDYDVMEYIACRGDFPMAWDGMEIVTVQIRDDTQNIFHAMTMDDLIPEAAP